MPKPEISYALPVSCLEVSGTVTETHDTILDVRSSAPVTTVALHTHGIDRNQVLQILTGTMRDTSLALQLTHDGLLTSADAESTGQLGKTVVGVVGAAAALGSLVALPPPISAAAAAAAAAIAGHEAADAHAAYLGGRGKAKEDTLEQKIGAAYNKAYPDVAPLRDRYATLVNDAVARIATLAEGMLGGDPNRTTAAQISQQRELLTVLRAELELLDKHFATWRAGTISTHTAEHQRCFSLDVLRGSGVEVTNSAVTFARDADASVQFAWDTLGVAVTMDPAGTPRNVPGETRPNAVIVRLPRRIRLSVYERVAGRPVLRQEKAYLVVDSACETQVVRFRRSLWAKRSTKLGFGDLGVLTSYAVGSTSSASALADTAGQLPKTVSSDLDEAAKIAKDLSANGATLAKAATPSS